MLKVKQFSLLTVIVFSLVLLAHLARILYGWNMNIGGWEVPMWVSWLAVVVIGYLDYQGFRLRNTRNKK